MTVSAYLDLPAPAKLNLFLHLVGRREDGYHLLQSLFVLIDWCDRLHVEIRPDGRLQRHDLGHALPADDLCLRAARALKMASGCPLGADISIDKQVPWGAGMGGGSSDAATTLLALNRLWGLHWPRDRLLQIGLQLGADVPFFIGGTNALVEGIGERLTPADVPPRRLMVVKPPACLDTRRIFSSHRIDRSYKAAILSGSFFSNRALAEGSVEFLIDKGRNDLEAAAEAESAEVSQALAVLRRRFGNGRLTGSGSAVFARMANESVGGGLAEAGRGRPPGQAGDGVEGGLEPLAEPPMALPTGWLSRSCVSLPVHPLRDWAAG